jgi:hypothetical protein
MAILYFYINCARQSSPSLLNTSGESWGRKKSIHGCSYSKNVTTWTVKYTSGAIYGVANAPIFSHNSDEFFKNRIAASYLADMVLPLSGELFLSFHRTIITVRSF